MNTPYTHQIIPGVLEKEWFEIERKLEIIKTFSNKIHIDFIDQSFSQNTTLLDPAPFSKFNNLSLEAHLMVDEPINYLTKLSNAGFKKFIGHVEKMSSQDEFVAKGELLGEIGLALDLSSNIDQIKVSFEDLDFVLLMCVKAGESGQKFEESSIAKINALKDKTLIEVDGGINDQTIVQAKDAGANLFVSTSYITGSTNPQEQYNKLQSLIL